MRVSDPTITTLTVNWDAADGNVQGYKVIYVPANGGLEIMVRTSNYRPENTRSEPGGTKIQREQKHSSHLRAEILQNYSSKSSAK